MENKFVKHFFGLDGRSFVIVREDTLDCEWDSLDEKTFLLETEVRHTDGERFSRSRVRLSKTSIEKLIPILQEAVKNEE